MTKAIPILALLLLFPSGSAQAEEPDSIAAAAAALFAEAESYREEGDHSEAADLYEDLVDDFPSAPQAPLALLGWGECLERDDDLYGAFLVYQRILDDYPGQADLNEILQRQLQIGETFLGGRQRLLLFFRIRSGLGTAEEIFETMVKTAPFSQVAPLAQFNLARAIQMDGRYREAEVEYDHLLEIYAGSKVIPEALFQKGLCAYELSRGPNYEQIDTERALKVLDAFLERYPEHEHVAAAEGMREELRHRLARREYQIARFYESRDDALGAVVYYRTVVEKYPESDLATEAQAAIARLGDQAARQQKLLDALAEPEEDEEPQRILEERDL